LRQLIGIVALNDILDVYGVARPASQPERRE